MNAHRLRAWIALFALLLTLPRSRLEAQVLHDSRFSETVTTRLGPWFRARVSVSANRWRRLDGPALFYRHPTRPGRQWCARCRAMRSGRCKSFTPSTPAAKPPTCAQNAPPPPVPAGTRWQQHKRTSRSSRRDVAKTAHRKTAATGGTRFRKLS